MLREPEFEPLETPVEEDDPEGLIGAAAEASRLREGATHSGAMVALFPEAAVAAELALPGGELADDLHVTLAFLGTADRLPKENVLRAVAEWAARSPVFEGSISGVGHFADMGSGPVTYLSVDLPDLPLRREELVDALEKAGCPPSKDHGFTPHMTLDYKTRRPQVVQRPIRFERVTLAWAGERTSFQLGFLLQEGKWDPSLHPRWPQGTPRAGEFMKVGQRFIGADGKEWQIAHIAGGKVIANRAEGKYAETETGVFHPQPVKGADSPLPGGEETHVIPEAKKEAAPRKVQGGKGKGSTVAIVDPYVDPASHAASIPVPDNSKISTEEWQRFGELDQEHYAELMGRFGKYSPGKAKTMIDEAYKDYTAEIQAIVKNAYSAQYGASTGFTLSLTSVFQHLTGKDKKELAKLDAQRQRAIELQGRHKDVIAWDLYNRTRSPDVAVFHKSNDPTNYWQDYIAGNQPVMSGLSQSFNFGANFGFGSTTLATPLAIRHVLMSSYSAQPIPGQTHFQGELEISVAEQLKIDTRSITFSLHDITANQKKWLMGVTKAPAGGETVDRFREALQSGEMLPTPPAPPDIQMQGQGQKLWIDPPPEAADYIKRFADQLPQQQSDALDPGKLDKSGPWAFKDAGGLPKATVAKESEYKPGDYMLGLKGTLYLIVEDPGDDTGFGLRYVKIEDGKFSTESYNFEGGGKNQYFKLSAHYELPDPHKEAKTSELFDPHAWVNGEKEAFTGKLKPGEKFKVNGNPYEVKAQLSGAQTQITDLTSGKVGTINTDYKTHVLVPKEGYTPEAEVDQTKLAPAKGMTLAYEGKKHVVTTLLKDGTVKAKPTGGGKTVAIAADDPALGQLYDPTAHKIGAKVKVGDLAAGEIFHGGRGLTQRPYIVLGAEGNKVSWRSLDTGEEGVFTKAKVVRQLVDVEAEPAAEEPQNTPKPQDYFSADDLVEAGEKPLTSMEPKTKFTVWTGDVYELDYNVPGGDGHTLHATNVLTGETLPFSADAKGTVLVPKNEMGAEPVPHDQLKPNDATTLGNLQDGDYFDSDGQTFKVLVNPGGLEENLSVAMVQPSGHLSATETSWSFPDKLVYFKGNQSPPPQTDAPSGDGFPDLVSEGGFDPYKSKYGSGGKYTHDKLGEMAVGTVFHDKSGKLWKIKESDHTVIVSDGAVLYTADASVRGRVVQADFVDSTGPVKGPHSDPAEVEAAQGMTPNAAVTMGDIPEGSTVLVNGQVHIVKTAAEPGDEISALAALTELPGGNASLLGPDIVPDKVKLPPKAESVGSLHDGDEFKGAGKKTHTIVAKAIDGVVVMNGEGAMAKVPPGTALDAVDADAKDGLAAKPEVSPMPGNTKISELDDGAVYSSPSGLKTVIAKTLDGEVVVMEGTKPGGGMETLPKNAIINSNQVQPPQAGAVQTEWSPEVQKALDAANLSMDDIPAAPIASYKSKWGSGGKYQHYRLDELDPGDTFTDKAGALSSFVGAGPKGMALVFNPGTGAMSLVPAEARVKRV